MKRRILILTATLLVTSLPGMSGDLSAQTTTRTTAIRTDLDTIRGIITPAVEAVLSSEIQARITQMPLQDGQGFKRANS